MIPLVTNIFVTIAACLVYPAFGIGIYLISRYIRNGNKLKKFFFVPIILGFLFGISLLMAAISDLPR